MRNAERRKPAFRSTARPPSAGFGSRIAAVSCSGGDDRKISGLELSIHDNLAYPLMPCRENRADDDGSALTETGKAVNEFRFETAAGAHALTLTASPKKMEKSTARDRHWSQLVGATSDALDLQAGVFALTDPREIAQSLKQSADASRRRKSEPFRSAMSMLTFYINRAGKHLPQSQRDCLEKAKDELRLLYGRPRKNPGTSVAIES